MNTENLTPKESKSSENILKLGLWDSTETEESDSASTPREIYASIEVSREDLMEAKKDRLLLGFLKNKKVKLMIKYLCIEIFIWYNSKIDFDN